MGTYIYTKSKRKNLRKLFRFVGLSLAIVGLSFALYIFYPLISWQIYIKPVFASNFASPIPQTTILNQETIQSLIRTTFSQGDWLPHYKGSHILSEVPSYTITIPKLKIKNAIISTTDTDISKHLVHFPGTAVPPYKGNAVIFGHSTLPQLFNPDDYKTIFANAHTLKVGDKFSVTVKDTTLNYTIFNIAIVDAEDTSYLAQSQDDSYLTIVTCTPPGTIWQRLILKANIDKI